MQFNNLYYYYNIKQKYTIEIGFNYAPCQSNSTMLLHKQNNLLTMNNRIDQQNSKKNNNKKTTNRFTLLTTIESQVYIKMTGTLFLIFIQKTTNQLASHKTVLLFCIFSSAPLFLTQFTHMLTSSLLKYSSCISTPQSLHLKQPI